MPNHAVIVREVATSVSTPATVETGIPFIVGLSPIQNAESPAGVGVPVLVYNYAEFVSKLGWSDDWDTYNLCEFAYAHFKLYGQSPAIFCNLLDPATHKSAVAAADKDVVAKKVTLTVKGIDDAGLVVKAQGGNGDAYVKDTDYSVYYDEDGKLTVEALPDGACYSATKLNIAFNEVTPASINASAVAAGFENVELCMTMLGLIPDLLVAPGFSQNSVVAAIMATKAAGINGMFKAKALIDIDTTVADAYDEVVAEKTSKNFFDKNQIVCWPMVKLGDLKFHLSSHIAGIIARTDYEYAAPYVSPSNKDMKCDTLIVAAGTEVVMSLDQANYLNANGVCTGLNFMGGFKAWGNYTACYPSVQDVKDYFIPVNRMFDWVGNTLIKTFWYKLDEAMNRRLIDSILDSANIWLNGLTGSGYILGGRVEMLESENPVTDLMAGIVRLHVYITPPSPAQEIDFTLEYDVSYVEEALG
jgi:hypothetical protein